MSGFKILKKLRMEIDTTKKIKRDPYSRYPILDKELSHWFITMEQQGVQILVDTIRLKALKIAKTFIF
jgi:predicted peroxiredoxin